ncbi:protease complex subunit PrcB family protein [Clostridium sp. SYSU_GA19001]|uniref:protease complex subunit PrcB family protein n=1 Tax=Clostridium caldaquaticum TaxID=2940653 RepID=UPI002077412C|nr:protease complex subunit PrcB family protein [Clostridium caldaquaticum]MCM8711125.1 protease complex subunit PrcB family protein [Clostridium caldaquaticum]
MKQINRFFILIFFVIFLFGCSTKDNKDNSYKSSIDNSSVSAKDSIKDKTITVNKINFEEIKDENKLPQNMRYSINVLKANKGYILYDENGYYYITIFSGKKNTGGYSVRILSVEENKGKINILVEEKSPQPGSIVSQAVTYPYTTIKIINTIGDFTITNTIGESYEKVMEGEETY